MARPIKNSCDYFPHDADMRNHRKVKSIRNKFGIQGYAIWSMLIEYLTGIDGNEFEYSDIEFELISGDFGVSVTEIRDVVDYCIKLQMLFINNNFIYSETLNKRLEPVYTKRGRAKESSEKQKRNNGKYVKCDNNTDKTDVSVTEIPQIKEKEIKEKESKLNTVEFSEKENSEHNQNVVLPINQKPEIKKEEQKRVWVDGVGDGELYDLLAEYWKNPNSPSYTPEMYKAFRAYWTALVQIGKGKGKERWRTEKTFSISGRLANWNSNNFNKNGNNNGFNSKKPELKPTGIEPTNGRRFGKL